ncbi:MAG: fumarate hydratase [Treponema sp.]|jgi:fumarate hydratase subunit alpha|nr:fumarate hydratase [Treponema sp.]
MRILTADRIAETVKRLCIRANRELPEPVKQRIRECRRNEPWPLAQGVLDTIIDNFELAGAEGLPICQDTGAVWVLLEIGFEAHIEGDVYEAVHEGVRQGYREGYFRNSMVRDPLRRVNTGDNTPAMITLEFAPGDRVVVTVAPKGFGSENMSRIRMLQPADGIEGLVDFVVAAVEEAGPNPCPPIVAGVGIGGTFDKAALLAKKALLRPLGRPNQDPFYEGLEKRLLEALNRLGIGPQGFGGRTTALAVAIETMATHIAALPCAVNINCHVNRHAQESL